MLYGLEYAMPVLELDVWRLNILDRISPNAGGIVEVFTSRFCDFYGKGIRLKCISMALYVMVLMGTFLCHIHSFLHWFVLKLYC